jgi:HEAT repeat protein
MLLTLKYDREKFKVVHITDEVKKNTQFSKIFKDNYVVLLSLFLIVSVVTLNFNQYIFQNLLNIQYPTQRELTNFLGYFNGVIYLLSLVMQTFLNDKILATYGIRVSLFILPIFSVILALISLFTGLFFGAEAVISPIFFLFVALTRLFNSMIRESLENPIFKLLFVPLGSSTRFGIQAKVEGVISEFGRLIAGTFIFAFSLIPFFQITWVLAMVVVLCVLYFLIVQRLNLGYRSKIQSKLEIIDTSQVRLELGYKEISRILEKRLTDENTPRAVFSFKLLEKINPSEVSSWVNVMMRNTRDDARDYAQRRMNEIKGLSVSDQYVIKLDRDAHIDLTKKLLTKAELMSLIESRGNITKNRIRVLARSTEVSDRQYAAELLLHSSSDESISYLVELLSDPEPKVRKTAISTAIKINNTEVIFALINNLDDPMFSNQTMNALVLIAGDALTALENSFYRASQNTQIVLRIVQVIGRIGGPRAKEILWSKIDYPNKIVVSQLLVSLGECGFKADASQITRINYAIESDIANIAWNLNTLVTFARTEENPRLIQALVEENQHDIDHIYMLMAMLYDTRSIQLVKENIESGTSEGITYAIELLDVFLSDQLKVKIIPILDDLSNEEKLNRLEIFFPAINLDHKLALKFLINRDFTQSNRWTKVCALEEIGNKRIAEFKLDLIAHLFNPDQMIREMAGWALYKIESEEYHKGTLRLDEITKRSLDARILQNSDQLKLRLFEKVIFFQQLELFSGVSGVALSFLADISKEQKLAAGQFLPIDEKMNNDFFIVYKGTVRYHEKNNHVADFATGQFIGEMLTSAGITNSSLLMAKEESILLKINKDEFYELLSDSVKLADVFLKYI